MTLLYSCITHFHYLFCSNQKNDELKIKRSGHKRNKNMYSPIIHLIYRPRGLKKYSREPQYTIRWNNGFIYSSRSFGLEIRLTIWGSFETIFAYRPHLFSWHDMNDKSLNFAYADSVLESTYSWYILVTNTARIYEFCITASSA